MLAQVAQTGGELPGYGSYLLTSLVVLVVVCVLAWGVLRFGLRRLIPQARVGGDGPVKVLARVPLEPRQTLYVIEVAGKTVLVGGGDRPLSVLMELDGEAVRRELAAQPQPRSFAEVLRRLTGREQPEETP